MNLTAEVRDGIVNHTGPNDPFTLEGQIVHLADRIAYINHDIDDALRSGVINLKDIPESSIELFGSSHRARINSLVIDVIKNSEGKDKICQSPAFKKEMDHLRKFMFANVYKNSQVKRDEDLNKVETVIRSLYEYYLDNPGLLPEDLREISERDGVAEAVKDYIAGMTDRFALSTYTDLFVPKGWK
jgi:dGTPase